MKLPHRRVLVTGAEGFIGSHLVEALVSQGCKVRAMYLYNSFSSWGWLESLAPEVLKEVEVIPGDVRDSSGVRDAMQGIEAVFHLAALIAIPFSYRAPASYVDTNVTGTLNILQAARDLKCERVFVTSTSEVYGTAQVVPIDEKHPMQGQSPYSATKIGADRLAESYWRSFETPVTIVRPFNTFGPRQSARAVIPTIITQMLAGEKTIKLGSLHPTRDFVFVEDTARGFVEIAKSDATLGEEINIATGNEISIGDLVAMLSRLTGVSVDVQTEDQRIRPPLSEVERLLGSCEKLRRLTGWAPGTSLEAGLQKTVSWFREHGRNYKAGMYNV